MCLKTADVASEDVWGIMLTWRGRSRVHVHTARALFFIILIILKAKLSQEPLKGHGLCPYTTFTVEENENGPCCSLEYFNSKYSASWARMSSACKQKIADKIDANNQHLPPPPTPANFTPANLALAELADVATQPRKKARLE